MKNNLTAIQSYQWQGVDQAGTRLKGTSSGLNEAAVREALKNQKITPISIKKEISFLSALTDIPLQDIVLFSRHLATMVTAGIPLIKALEIIANGQTKNSMRYWIMNICHEVSHGKSLSEALAQFLTKFNSLFCSLVKLGENSGTLDIILQRLADYLEKYAALKKNIQKSLFYPVTILGISFVIAILLLIFVLPQFQTLFESFDANLPFFTLLIIKFSHWLQHVWYLFLSLMTMGIIFLMWATKKSRIFRQTMDMLVLRIPIFGKLIKKAAIARIMRTLATILNAGIPVLEALTNVASIAHNTVYSNALLQVREDVARGQQIHIAMNFSHLFPSMVLQMIAVGESSGTLDVMLNKIANFYEEEVSTLVTGLSALMEPILIVILGVIIGSFTLAMYLPIFKLGAIA